NMITAVTISLAIAFEKLESGAMERPPRNPDAKLVSGYYVFRIAFVAAIVCSGLLYMNRALTEAGFNPAVVNTMTVQALVISQLLYLFNCRSEKDFVFRKGFFSNKAAFIVSGILVAVQLGVTYLPVMNLLLGTVPIAAHHWIWPISIGISVFTIVEVEKWVRRKLSASR
ncbi:MAG TPA: cation transporting ATPase C-terminal domain-containing protein, partial [Planococcus sp. (in: firmicutes)]|nr:cation transporting ATPase C-terminal domain-containing protein [Planococcus sp. (in: firmicutes)]